MNGYYPRGESNFRAVAEEVTFPLSDQEIISWKDDAIPQTFSRSCYGWGNGACREHWLLPQPHFKNALCLPWSLNIRRRWTHRKPTTSSYYVQSKNCRPHSVQDAALGEGEGCLSGWPKRTWLCSPPCSLMLLGLTTWPKMAKHRIKLKGYNSMLSNMKLII